MGKRGEGYVVIQGILFVLIILAPRFDAINLSNNTLRLLAALLLLSGFIFALLALTRLGQNLSPLPHPKDKSQLVTHGIYAYVRHPIYSSLMLLAFGWAAWNLSLLTLLGACILAIFFDVKARREEHFLQQKFSAYEDYKAQVKKFFPFIY